MVRKILFSECIPANCTVVRIEGELSDREDSARSYELKLTETVDVLLLSVGLDGHIASLFPGNNALQENSRSVIHVVGPKSPPDRLTITSFY